MAAPGAPRPVRASPASPAWRSSGSSIPAWNAAEGRSDRPARRGSGGAPHPPPPLTSARARPARPLRPARAACSADMMADRSKPGASGLALPLEGRGGEAAVIIKSTFRSWGLAARPAGQPYTLLKWAVGMDPRNLQGIPGGGAPPQARERSQAPHCTHEYHGHGAGRRRCVAGLSQQKYYCRAPVAGACAGQPMPPCRLLPQQLRTSSHAMPAPLPPLHLADRRHAAPPLPSFQLHQQRHRQLQHALHHAPQLLWGRLTDGRHLR